MSTWLDTIVVGGGVIGLACARALAQAGRGVVVLEAEAQIGLHQSSRNSEVIHAGLYYPAGSRKALLCCAGREALYAYLAQRHIAHQRLGKLVVATTQSQLNALQALYQQAVNNGVPGVELLDSATAMARQPGIRCAAALWSPHTGIFDTHAYLLALLADLEDAGGRLVTRSAMLAADSCAGGFAVRLNNSEALIRCRRLVIAAGVHSPALIAALNMPYRDRPQAYFARGCYYTLRSAHPFQHLVYPLPEDAGLGVHLCLDLAGRARFGPDVSWQTEPDLGVDPQALPIIEQSVRRWWPALRAGSLQPGYAGVRAKISGPGEPAADFRIDGPDWHGQPGLVCLSGIESPGLTASLAIAGQVCRQLGD